MSKNFYWTNELKWIIKWNELFYYNFLDLIFFFSSKFQKSELLYLDVFGMLNDSMLQTLRAKLPNIEINKFYFSSVARPTVGIRRTSIWGLKVREWNRVVNERRNESSF